MGMFDNQSSDNTNNAPQGGGQEYSQTNDPFSRVGSSDPNEQSVYPIPGVYPLLYLDTLKMIRSRKGDDVFVAEFDILESEVETRPRGTRMSWVVNFRHDAAPGNVKGFLASLMGISVGEVDADGARYACSPKNPCHGKLVRLEASEIITKGTKQPFTLCKWVTVDAEKQAQSKELREGAGFPPF